MMPAEIADGLVLTATDIISGKVIPRQKKVDRPFRFDIDVKKDDRWYYVGSTNDTNSKESVTLFLAAKQGWRVVDTKSLLVVSLYRPRKTDD